MSKKKMKIKDVEKVTHNVLRFTLEDSQKIDFTPGQATTISVDKEGWREEDNPFTFTSLPEDDHLEFTIKIYPKHQGVTNELSKLKAGEEVILHSVFGAIEYKGSGTFIAGGAGVTPFISIIRELDKENKLKENRLIFANSRKEDIINKEEFKQLLGDDFINILSREKTEEYDHGYIDAEYIKKHAKDLDDYFYVCGPMPMIESVVEDLKTLGVKEDKIVKEEF